MYHSLTKVLLALVLVVGLSWAAPATLDAAAPVLNLSPSSGPIGTKVTVSVCNMTPDNTIAAGSVTFADAPWNPREISLDSAGCTGPTVLTVPVAPVGSSAVMVNDGNVTKTGVFTVTQPKIAISPTSGYKGQTLTVTGTVWPAFSFVTLTFNDSSIEVVVPGSDGSFSTQLTVPLTAVTSNTVGASDNLGNSGTARTFSLKPVGLTVSPVSGQPGTLVGVTGIGFQPRSVVEELKIASIIISTPVLMTSEVGSFTTTFTVPSLPGGGKIISATVAGFTRTVGFAILEPDVWSPADEDIPTPVEQALASISDKVIRVWGYYAGEWQMYDPLDPLGSDLTGLVRGRAYWIKVSADDILIFRSLRAGWNNIGW